MEYLIKMEFIISTSMKLTLKFNSTCRLYSSEAHCKLWMQWVTKINVSEMETGEIILF